MEKNMGTIRCWVAIAAIGILAGTAFGDTLIGVPDAPPSRVDEAGVLYEDWGTLAITLQTPQGAAPGPQTIEVSPAPTVINTTTAGPVTLTQRIYRAPIWPAGVDVIALRAENAGTEACPVQLAVNVPQDMGGGEAVGVVRGRAVLALPQNLTAQRKMKDWGTTGGIAALSGWAKPNTGCDPAFKNISAGMGGIPIEYRFAVPKGEGRTIILGFCESHWDIAGRRPLALNVEGAPAAEIDPIAAWGRHTPGCLEFDARDADADGYITVIVAPHPKASDKNPILNVIWVFRPDAAVDISALQAGNAAAQAEHYVDVGGEKDQALYEDGPFSYAFTLAPGAAQDLMFWAAPPGARVPEPTSSAWTPESLVKVANDVWRDWFGQAEGLLTPEAGPARLALSRIAMNRAQADGYFIPLETFGQVGQFSAASAAEAVAALDDAGLFEEAERMLRTFTDKPVPEPFAALAQHDDGQWCDNAGSPCAHGTIMGMLARHGLVSGNAAWSKKACPALEAGANWLTQEAAQDLTAEAKAAALEGLHQAAKLAQSLGDDQRAEQFAAIAQKLSAG